MGRKYKIGDVVLTKNTLWATNGQLLLLIVYCNEHSDLYRCNLIAAEDSKYVAKSVRLANVFEVWNTEIKRVVDHIPGIEIQPGDMVLDNCYHADESTRRYGTVTKVDTKNYRIFFVKRDGKEEYMELRSVDKQPSDPQFMVDLAKVANRYKQVELKKANEEWFKNGCSCGEYGRR